MSVGILGDLAKTLLGDNFDLTKIFDSFGADGANGGFMDFLGSDLAKNALAGGLAFNQNHELGDMMDFNKTMATRADARTQSIFDTEMQNNKEDRDIIKGIDFGQAV